MSVLKKIFHQDKNASLPQRAVQSVFWVFLLRVSARGLQVLRVIVVAGILPPEDFGLFGIVLLSVSMLEAITQSGFDTALIQKNKDIRNDLDTAWVVQITRGILLTIIMFLSAPVISAFFNRPDAAALIRMTAFIIAVRGFKNIGVVYFIKDLEFKKAYIYQISGILSGLIVTIVGALLLRNVWAFFWGQIIGDIIQTLFSYIVHPYRPVLRFNPQRAKELYRFGRWIMVRNILQYFNTHGDDIILGKMLGTVSLGLYQVAYRMSDKFLFEVRNISSQVALPLYSILQQDKKRLKRVYLESFKLSLLLSVWIAGGLFILAPEFVLIFMGSTWQPMVPALRILTAAGLLNALSPLVGPLLTSVGRPDVTAKIVFVRFVVLASAVYPMTLHFGIQGTAITVAVSLMITLPLLYYQARRLVMIEYLLLLKAMLPSISSGALMILITGFLKRSIPPDQWGLLTFIAFGLGASVVYFGGLFLWEKMRPSGGYIDIIQRRVFGG